LRFNNPKPLCALPLFILQENFKSLMKSLFIWLVTLGSAVPLFAQSVQLLDSVTQEPIAYAHLVYLSNGKQNGGLYTNPQGKATLANLGAKDSVVITCLGYSSIALAQQALKDTLYLVPQAYALAEVNIYPKGQQKTEYLGTSRDKKSQTYTTYSGFKWLVFVANPAKENKLIKQFYFEISKRASEGDYTAKVIFYENDNDKPGRQINYEKTIVVNRETKRKITVDVSDAYLNLPPQGMYVGLEWVGCFEERKLNAKCQLAVKSVTLDDNEDCAEQAYTLEPYRSKAFFDSNLNRAKGNCKVPVFGLFVFE
jgi:hypothetical protein